MMFMSTLESMDLNASEVTFCVEFKDHIWVEIPLREKSNT